MQINADFLDVLLLATRDSDTPYPLLLLRRGHRGRYGRRDEAGDEHEARAEAVREAWASASKDGVRG